MSTPSSIDPSLALNQASPAIQTNIIQLFLEADIVVQFVIISLALASIWSWTIIFAKSSQLRSLINGLGLFEKEFWNAGDHKMLFDKKRKAIVHQPVERLFLSIYEAFSAAPTGRANNVLTEFFDRKKAHLLYIFLSREQEGLQRNMAFLASVGSTAPFIGLFGTVWGIMHSFRGIAASQSTNLAVVAPGIAEALFATAIGLIAAIPAVLAYNRISTLIRRYLENIELFTEEFSSTLESSMNKE